VLILEKASVFGGTTAISGGTAYIFNNYLLREQGVEDSREMSLTYLRHVAGGQSDEELMAAYVDKGNEMIEWLRDNAGFVWTRSEGSTTFAEYYPYEGALPEGQSRGVRPAPLDDGTTSGPALMTYARRATDEREIEILFDTAGHKLVTSAEGQVIGVIASSEGSEMAIKARRGVIIGTGGFDHNEEMRSHFLRGPILAANSVITNTGDGHLMGMAIGADLRNMNECWGLPFFKPDPDLFSGIADWQLWRGKPGTVVVNKHGERIGNESANYDAAVNAFYHYDTGTFEWRNIPSFFICDSGYTDHYPLPGSFEVGAVPDWITVADTLDELAEALGIDARGLESTIETFNGYAENGVDLDWRRGESDFDKYTAGDVSRNDLRNPCLAPLETPSFYGAALWPGTTGTNGGLRTNASAQVLNVWGEVIPRLYCTSNTMASVMGVGYAGGGGTLGPGMTFGYVAGQHAAALEPWG
ncbi:MAG TPA: FAD-binding protein, partial [Chloroflexi bacterium]|nr:FAD-binding protein [Chloroflexota bacterium]